MAIELVSNLLWQFVTDNGFVVSNVVEEDTEKGPQRVSEQYCARDSKHNSGVN